MTVFPCPQLWSKRLSMHPLTDFPRRAANQPVNSGLVLAMPKAMAHIIVNFFLLKPSNNDHSKGIHSQLLYILYKGKIEVTCHSN